MSRSIQIGFQNSLAGQNLNQVFIDTSSLTANIGGITRIEQTVTNGATTNERQELRFPTFDTWNPQTSGAWYLNFGDEVSAPLLETPSSSAIATALNAFQGIDQVTVTGLYPNFVVTFGGNQSRTNMPDIRMDTTNLYHTSSRSIVSSYNAEDELTSVSDPAATINYTRDNLGACHQDSEPTWS